MFYGQVCLHGTMPVSTDVNTAPDDEYTVTFRNTEADKVTNWLRGAGSTLQSIKTTLDDTLRNVYASMPVVATYEEQLGMISVMNLVEYTFDLPVTVLYRRL